MVKNPPAMCETWVQSLGWEDPLEEGTTTRSSILAWRIPMDRGAWQTTVHGVEKGWTQLSDSTRHGIFGESHYSAHCMSRLSPPAPNYACTLPSHIHTTCFHSHLFFFSWPCHTVLDRGSQTKDQTHVPCTGSAQS